MTTIASHLSVEGLRDRYVASADVMEARHFQTIWLLAKGHSVGDVAEMTSFGRRARGLDPRASRPQLRRGYHPGTHALHDGSELY